MEATQSKQTNPRTLEGKVAIVTGATSGIGRVAAKRFAAEGARVVVSGRREALLNDLVAEITHGGGMAEPVPGDITERRCAEALVQTASDRFGGLDIAFNNAGTLGELAPIGELSPEGWDHTIAVNLTGAFLAARAQVPALMARGGGTLLFTSTFVGHTVGMAGMSAYAASKAGMIGLTKSLAAELGTHGIRVNALLPGGTDTPMGRTVANSPESIAYVQGLHALGRMADPEEIASAALFLVSDAASFVTGTAMLVDGGVSVLR